MESAFIHLWPATIGMVLQLAKRKWMKCVDFLLVSSLLSKEEVFLFCDHSSAVFFLEFPRNCLNFLSIIQVIWMVLLCDYVPEINRPTSSPYYYGERRKNKKKKCILITSNLTQTSIQLIATATTKIATMKRACNKSNATGKFMQPNGAFSVCD